MGEIDDLERIVIPVSSKKSLTAAVVWNRKERYSGANVISTNVLQRKVLSIAESAKSFLVRN